MPSGFRNLASMGWRQARRLVILVLGSTVILLGIALIVLPGPAAIAIPAGLAILATEFVWARRLLREVKNRTIQLRDAVMHRNPTPQPNNKNESLRPPTA